MAQPLRSPGVSLCPRQSGRPSKRACAPAAAEPERPATKPDTKGSAPMKAFSWLDFAIVTEGQGYAEALGATLKMAQSAERFGYRRFWLAEHHSMRAIASSATAVALAAVGACTSTIRIGAGGVMLPNHAPLLIAEQFGTLEALYPKRVDLGLGRAPGTDPLTARALRRNDLAESADNYPSELAELMDYLRVNPSQGRIVASPGVGSRVPIWLLGSGLFSARFAARMGLPFAFASHFAPRMIGEALDVYREEFRPSEYLGKPYVMAGANVIAAPTDEAARLLFSSQRLSVLALVRGRNDLIQPPNPDLERDMSRQEKAAVDGSLLYSFVGTKETVAQQAKEFVDKFKLDEILCHSRIFDLEARLESLRLGAEALRSIRNADSK